MYIYTHRDLWPKQHVLDLSSHPAVRRVVALGTILIVELREHEGATGYQSEVTIFSLFPPQTPLSNGSTLEMYYESTSHLMTLHWKCTNESTSEMY
jgi:hypothetical protein